jgi:hypothetical protein
MQSMVKRKSIHSYASTAVFRHFANDSVFTSNLSFPFALTLPNHRSLVQLTAKEHPGHNCKHFEILLKNNIRIKI